MPGLKLTRHVVCRCGLAYIVLQRRLQKVLTPNLFGTIVPALKRAFPTDERFPIVGLTLPNTAGNAQALPS